MFRRKAYLQQVVGGVCRAVTHAAVDVILAYVNGVQLGTDAGSAQPQTILFTISQQPFLHKAEQAFFGNKLVKHLLGTAGVLPLSPTSGRSAL